MLQQQFLSIVDDFAAKYKAATNEMPSEGLRPKRASAICDLLEKGKITDGAGIAQTLSSRNEGKGVQDCQYEHMEQCLSDYSD